MEQQIHNIYVLDVGSTKTSKDVRRRDLTLSILRYIHQKLPIIKQMGVKIQVHKIKKSELSSKRLVKAMKKRRISSLPALVTPKSTYIGNESIRELYEKNITEYNTFLNSKTNSGINTTESGDDLDNYFQNEIKVGDNESEGGMDEDEDPSNNMMDNYRKMLQRRESGNKTQQQSKPEQEQHPHADREDNITDVPIMNSVMSSGNEGMDGMDENSQDAFMEQAFWANQEESI